MGIFIGEPQYLSKGYGYYAVEQIKHIAFDEMNLVKIYLRVMTNNERGIHCYRKSGFEITEREEIILSNGNPASVYRMEVERN